MEGALEYASNLKAQGYTISTKPEEIKVDNESGGHFTASFNNGVICDKYIFMREKAVIIINAYCEPYEFEENKKEIEKAINSIDFNPTHGPALKTIQEQ